MHVVITNDDGVGAPGLHRLAAAVVAAGHEVVVAAPRAEASGSGAALTAVTEDDRVRVERWNPPQGSAPTYPCLAVDASPAYIALLAALGAFGPPPDVLLSGINRGANAGHAVLHSGTVGAALTAANHGLRAMAVSLDVLSPAAASASSGGAALASLDTVEDVTRNWDTAAVLAAELLPALVGAPPRTVLNLNVPDAPTEQVRGLRHSTLADFGQVQVAIAESGEGFVRTSLREHEAELDPGTDLAHLAEGYATITALRGVHQTTDVVLDLPVHSA